MQRADDGREIPGADPIRVLRGGSWYGSDDLVRCAVRLYLDRHQFMERLRTAEEDYDPVEELLDMQRDLIELEQKHGEISTYPHHKHTGTIAGQDARLEATMPLHLGDVRGEIDRYLQDRSLKLPSL